MLVEVFKISCRFAAQVSRDPLGHAQLTSDSGKHVMGRTFRENIPNLSDDEVMKYITDRRRYVIEAVEVAIAELAKRGKALSSTEINEIRADMRDIEEKRKEGYDDTNIRISEAYGVHAVARGTSLPRNPFVLMIIFLSRWYLRRRWRDMSYEVALMVPPALVFFNLLALSRLFGFDLDVFSHCSDTSALGKIQFGLTYGLPAYVVMRVVAPKDKVLLFVSDQDSATLGGLIFGGYLILSVVFLVLVR